MKNKPITWSLVVASNSEDILKNNLLKSAAVVTLNEVFIKRNFPNIAKAYNEGIQESSCEYVVFAHQDIFLPKDFSENFENSVKLLSAIDPNWGVAGVFGIAHNGTQIGYAYSSGLKRYVGQPFNSPKQIRTIDEMLIILRRSAQLQFDEDLPGFHLYGTDICLESETRGMKNYVLPCFVLHNSTGIKFLPLSFWKAYYYLRKKWRNHLPIATPCTRISFFGFPILQYILSAIIAVIKGNRNIGSPVDDPAKFLADL